MGFHSNKLSRNIQQPNSRGHRATCELPGLWKLVFLWAFPHKTPPFGLHCSHQKYQQNPSTSTNQGSFFRQTENNYTARQIKLQPFWWRVGDNLIDSLRSYIAEQLEELIEREQETEESVWLQTDKNLKCVWHVVYC